jgi:hypothetical protein
MTACPYCGDDPSTPVLERYSFTIEIAIPNPQNLKGGGKRLHNSGAGRWAYAKIRDRFAHTVRSAQDLGLCPNGRKKRVCRVVIERLWGPRKRRWDREAVVIGSKPLIDALVNAGALVDDSERYARIHYQQRKRTEGGACAVHVLIEVLDVPVAP